MKVLKKWREHPDKLKAEGESLGWFEVALHDCLEQTEGRGYWKKDTVEKMLREGVEVYNPFALYKAITGGLNEPDK